MDRGNALRRLSVVTLALALAWLSGCATAGGDPSVARLAQPLKAALASEQIGSELDEMARGMAAGAEYRALETGAAGAAVNWRASKTVFGAVTPQQPYTVGATTCRRYTHTVSVDGAVSSAAAIACRGEDGVWAPLS